MRKTLLSLLVLSAFAFAGTSQTVYVDHDGLDLTFGAWSGASYETVANPVSDGVNSSANVGKFNVGPNPTWWPGAASDPIGGKFDLSVDSIFTVKLLCDQNRPVLFKIENSSIGDTFIETIVDYTGNGAWQEVTFDLGDRTNASWQLKGSETADYDKFVIIPGTGAAAVDELWYVDDITGPAFVPGADVEVEVLVFDLENTGTSVEIEFSSNAGTKIPLVNDGTGVWSVTQTVPGNTYKDSYTYTIYVDGAAVAEQTDVPLGLAAGADPAELTYAFGTYTPIVYADFETLNLGGFDGFGGSEFEEVANPNTTGNSSATVGKVTTGTETWAGVASKNLGGTISFQKSKEFKMKVLSDNTGVVLLKLELKADPNAVFHEIRVNYDTPGEWKELTFTATNAAAEKTYDGFAVFCDEGVNDQGEIWYFDDLVGPDFVKGDSVDVTINVTDRENKTNSVEIEFSNDPGNKIALTDPASNGRWTGTYKYPGDTYLEQYTYTIFVDGAAVAERTDAKVNIGAGTGTGIISYAYGVYVPTEYVNFEDLNPGWFGWSGAAFDILPNPVSDGVNSSETVLEFNKGPNPTWWSGIASQPIGGKFDFGISKEFTMKVLSDTAGPVLFKIEDPADNGNNLEVAVDYTTPGQWQELTFDLSSPDAANGDQNADFGKFALLPDKGDAGAAGHIWWLDDITGPPFVAGDDVEVTIEVTDLDNKTSSVEIEFSSDAGTKIPVPLVGDTIFTTVVTVPGNTYKDAYTYTLYIDGLKAPSYTDKDQGFYAGSDATTISIIFGGGVTTDAEASYFGINYPIVDGEIDEAWDEAAMYRVITPFGADEFADTTDLNGYFKAGWDEYGLYVLVVVNDDYYFTDLTDGAFGEAYEKDKIEMFIDMNVDNLKDGGSPSQANNDGSNGHYQVAPINFLNYIDPPSFWDPILCERGFNTISEVSGDTAITGEAYQAIGEYYIPWSVILDTDGNEVTPDSTVKIGFDLTLTDNDGEINWDGEGEARDRLVWASTIIQAWESMDGSGTLTFVGQPEDPNAVEDMKNNRFRVYPNPAGEVIYISNSSEIRSVSMYNMLGTQVKHIQTNRDSNLSINTSDLNQGLYIISIVSEKGVRSNSKLIIE